MLLLLLGDDHSLSVLSFALQLQASNEVLFTVLVVVGLAAVAVTIIVFSIRRTSSISDELSDEAKAKLGALVSHPAKTDEETRPKRNAAAPNPLPTMPSQRTENAYRGYVSDTSGMEKMKLHDQIASLTAEIRIMTERLRSNDEELQKLRKIVEEQGVKLHIQEQREFDNHRTLEDLKVSVVNSIGSQPRLCLKCQRAFDPLDRFCYGCGYPVRSPQGASQ